MSPDLKSNPVTGAMWIELSIIISHGVIYHLIILLIILLVLRQSNFGLELSSVILLAWNSIWKQERKFAEFGLPCTIANVAQRLCVSLLFGFLLIGLAPEILWVLKGAVDKEEVTIFVESLLIFVGVRVLWNGVMLGRQVIMRPLHRRRREKGPSTFADFVVALLTWIVRKVGRMVLSPFRVLRMQKMDWFFLTVSDASFRELDCLLLMGIFSSMVVHALNHVFDGDEVTFSTLLVVYGVGSFLSFRHHLISNLGLNSMTKVMVSFCITISLILLLAALLIQIQVPFGHCAYLTFLTARLIYILCNMAHLYIEEVYYSGSFWCDFLRFPCFHTFKDAVVGQFYNIFSDPRVLVDPELYVERKRIPKECKHIPPPPPQVYESFDQIHFDKRWRSCRERPSYAPQPSYPILYAPTPEQRQQKSSAYPILYSQYYH